MLKSRKKRSIFLSLGTTIGLTSLVSTLVSCSDTVVKSLAESTEVNENGYDVALNIHLVNGTKLQMLYDNLINDIDKLIGDKAEKYTDAFNKVVKKLYNEEQVASVDANKSDSNVTKLKTEDEIKKDVEAQINDLESRAKSIAPETWGRIFQEYLLDNYKASTREDAVKKGMYDKMKTDAFRRFSLKIENNLSDAQIKEIFGISPSSDKQKLYIESKESNKFNALITNSYVNDLKDPTKLIEKYTQWASVATTRHALFAITQSPDSNMGWSANKDTLKKMMRILPGNADTPITSNDIDKTIFGSLLKNGLVTANEDTAIEVSTDANSNTRQGYINAGNVLDTQSNFVEGFALGVIGNLIPSTSSDLPQIGQIKSFLNKDTIPKQINDIGKEILKYIIDTQGSSLKPSKISDAIDLLTDKNISEIGNIISRAMENRDAVSYQINSKTSLIISTHGFHFVNIEVLDGGDTPTTSILLEKVHDQLEAIKTGNTPKIDVLSLLNEYFKVSKKGFSFEMLELIKNLGSDVLTNEDKSILKSTIENNVESMDLKQINPFASKLVKWIYNQINDVNKIKAGSISLEQLVIDRENMYKILKNKAIIGEGL